MPEQPTLKPNELQAEHDLLQDSERLLESGSWRLSHDAQNAMVWTPQLRRLLELPADESASLQALLERVHPEDQHLLRATLRQSWLSGQPFRLEHRLLFSDGRTSLVLHFGDTHCDETGAALETLGILQPLGDQTSLKEALERATHRDSLTGLPNRLASLEQLEQLLQAAPYNQQIAVLCFDLDKFQNINDSFGVEIGNDLLRWIAAHLRAQLAPSDWLAHLDADTFLIIRREGVRSLATALDLARTLQESLKHVVPELEPLRALQLSACLGVSVAPDHGSQASGLLQSASTALSEAKQQGPGTIRSYSTAMSQRIRETLDIEQRLARAIDRQELRLEYQTQWDREGQLIGAEALLRWHTHRGEEIQPSLFIPLAEQSGLMRDIGPWVLEQSIRQLDLWNRAGCHLPRLAINVSAQQFSSEAIPLDERLLALCEQYQVSPDQLEIELTETALLQNQALAAQTMERLARCGVTLAIDDFGTGYSSLVTLQQLPVHRLKIDRCFIQDLATSPSDQTIVKATIGMAHELGLNCLAEGVETEAQQRMLQHLGCDSFQGFGLGHPIPPEQIQALLSTAPVKAMQLA